METTRDSLPAQKTPWDAEDGEHSECTLCDSIIQAPNQLAWSPPKVPHIAGDLRIPPVQ